MKTPPPIDRDELCRNLEAFYGIRPQSLTFLPRGEVSWGYRVETGAGDAYFLKLFGASSLPAWAARLTYRLRSVLHIEQVSCPLPGRSGDLLNTLAGYPAALFPFIDGQSLFAQPDRPAALYQLGRLLAQLHGCHELDSECCRVERFEILNLTEYRQVLAASASPQRLSGAAGAAQSLLAPHTARLEQLLNDLLDNQQRARQRPFIPCICHGDPTPGNILVTASGLPHLIDWDDVILAPRERDLVFWEHDNVFFENESSSPVIEGYRSLAGKCDLDPDITSFYQRQWTVGEIGYFGHRLLFREQDERQNQSDLENLEEELRWLWN